jgi:hypothetical protein
MILTINKIKVLKSGDSLQCLAHYDSIYESANYRDDKLMISILQLKFSASCTSSATYYIASSAWLSIRPSERRSARWWLGSVFADKPSLARQA